MDFKWDVNRKKALKSAALAAVVVFLASFDTPAELIALGLPAWTAQAGAILVAAVITSARNYGKVAKRLNIP